MLVQFVHDHESQRTIGAMHGLSPTRVAQLMRGAAYAWAKRQGIDISAKSVPFKNDARLVKNLYAAMRFYAVRMFVELETEER
jgi:GNAT superfamily N-acetyltransferase